MKKKLVVIVPVLLCEFLLSHKATAQLNLDDSTYYQTAVDNTLKVYHSAIKEQSAIFNGRMNVPYMVHFETGSPYFENEKFVTGKLVYDDVVYDDIELLYDQLNPSVTTLVPAGRLQLASEKIRSFSIAGHNFVRLQKTSSNKITTGFYEQVYAGKSGVFKKVEKSLREELQTGEVLRYIDEKVLYYVKRGEEYYVIKRKSELLKLFSDKKQQLQQYIRQNKLKFKNNMANTLVQVAAYYDQLSR